MKHYIAIDIGGTFIKHALVNQEADIVKSDKVKTPKTLEALLDLTEEITKTYQTDSLLIEGIAISSPGAVSDDGVIYGMSALPYIHGPNMKQLMEQQTNSPVFIENDANCAGLAEVWNGAAKGMKDVIVMVLGTGIGGAVMKEGSLHKGAHLHGGEFGFMLVDRKHTTWSRAASTGGLVQNVEEAKGLESGSLNGEQIFQLATQGDQDCINAIDEFYYLLAIGIYNLQYIYDPEVILIGGGISARDDLIEQINKKLEVIINDVEIAKVFPKIQVCHYRQNANLLGAVYGYRMANSDS